MITITNIIMLAMVEKVGANLTMDLMIIIMKLIQNNIKMSC